jgi:hypothetical protein
MLPIFEISGMLTPWFFQYSSFRSTTSRTHESSSFLNLRGKCTFSPFRCGTATFSLFLSFRLHLQPASPSLLAGFSNLYPISLAFYLSPPAFSLSLLQALLFPWLMRLDIMLLNAVGTWRASIESRGLEISTLWMPSYPTLGIQFSRRSARGLWNNTYVIVWFYDYLSCSVDPYNLS